MFHPICARSIFIFRSGCVGVQWGFFYFLCTYRCTYTAVHVVASSVWLMIVMKVVATAMFLMQCNLANKLWYKIFVFVFAVPQGLVAFISYTSNHIVPFPDSHTVPKPVICCMPRVRHAQLYIRLTRMLFSMKSLVYRKKWKWSVREREGRVVLMTRLFQGGHTHNSNI